VSFLRPGSQRCLCVGCGEQFSTVRNFDLHRKNFQCVPPGSIRDKHGRPKLRKKGSFWVSNRDVQAHLKSRDPAQPVQQSCEE